MRERVRARARTGRGHAYVWVRACVRLCLCACGVGFVSETQSTCHLLVARSRRGLSVAGCAARIARRLDLAALAYADLAC